MKVNIEAAIRGLHDRLYGEFDIPWGRDIATMRCMVDSVGDGLGEILAAEVWVDEDGNAVSVRSGIDLRTEQRVGPNFVEEVGLAAVACALNESYMECAA